MRSTINVRIEARIQGLERMAQRWEFSGAPPQAAWEHDAENYVKDSPDFQGIEWIDSSNLIRWIVPLAGNEAKLNQDLAVEERRRKAMEAARQSRAPAVTRTMLAFGRIWHIRKEGKIPTFQP